MHDNRTKGQLAVLGMVALLGLAVVPFVSAAASAAPGPAVSAPVASWAYGGEASSNGSFSALGAEITWNATFGLVAIFNATNTSATTVELTAQRTMALSVTASASNGNGSFVAHYALKALEVDSAFANLSRNASVTLANGTNATALGILNASTHTSASLVESLTGSSSGTPFGAHLNASGSAHLAAAFTPALGLIPNNLSGVSAWSSTAVLNATSAWQYAYNWSHVGPLGSASGNGSHAGGWNSTLAVTLYGHAFAAPVAFSDHANRTEVVLALGGPFELRDGFVLIPGAFDFFNGDAKAYGNFTLGAAAISADVVFVRSGSLHVESVSAAQATFGDASAPLYVSGGSSGSVAAATPASVSPGSTVTAQPESPSTAQAQAACLKFGCSSAGPSYAALVVVGVVGVAALAAVAAIVGSRRKRPAAPQVLEPAGSVSPAPSGAGDQGTK